MPPSVDRALRPSGACLRLPLALLNQLQDAVLNAYPEAASGWLVGDAEAGRLTGIAPSAPTGAGTVLGRFESRPDGRADWNADDAAATEPGRALLVLAIDGQDPDQAPRVVDLRAWVAVPASPGLAHATLAVLP